MGSARDGTLRRTFRHVDGFRTGDVPVKLDGVVYGGQFHGRVGKIRLFVHPWFRAAEIPEIVVLFRNATARFGNDLPAAGGEGIYLEESVAFFVGTGMLYGGIHISADGFFQIRKLFLGFSFVFHKQYFLRLLQIRM